MTPLAVEGSDAMRKTGRDATKNDTYWANRAEQDRRRAQDLETANAQLRVELALRLDQIDRLEAAAEEATALLLERESELVAYRATSLPSEAERA